MLNFCQDGNFRLISTSSTAVINGSHFILVYFYIEPTRKHSKSVIYSFCPITGQYCCTRLFIFLSANVRVLIIDTSEYFMGISIFLNDPVLSCCIILFPVDLNVVDFFRSFLSNCTGEITQYQLHICNLRKTSSPFKIVALSNNFEEDIVMFSNFFRGKNYVKWWAFLW